MVSREQTVTTARALMSTMSGSAHQLEYPVCLEMMMDDMFLSAHFYASLVKLNCSAELLCWLSDMDGKNSTVNV